MLAFILAVLTTVTTMISPAPTAYPADYAPIAGAPAWAPFGMVPCGVEDATGSCYWDATKHNGAGQSFYVVSLDDTHSSRTYPFAPALDTIDEN
jgi:hypothetical protein